MPIIIKLGASVILQPWIICLDSRHTLEDGGKERESGCAEGYQLAPTQRLAT